MRTFFSLLLVFALAFPLAACGKPDRKTADKSLLGACEAAIKVLYAPEDTLTVQSKDFSDEKTKDGMALRKVRFTAHYVQNGGYVQEKEYACWFDEASGFGGYLPKFHALEKDGARLGNTDGRIEGDYTDLLKVQEATEKVLVR